VPQEMLVPSSCLDDWVMKGKEDNDVECKRMWMLELKDINMTIGPPVWSDFVLGLLLPSSKSQLRVKTLHSFSNLYRI
jgi:hypothetical protein